MIAQADYYKGFFEKGGAGFRQLVHHTTYFWMPLLGPAFFLWKLLDSEDTRSLKSIKPNFWSRPRNIPMPTFLDSTIGRRLTSELARFDKSKPIDRFAENKIREIVRLADEFCVNSNRFDLNVVGLPSFHGACTASYRWA